LLGGHEKKAGSRIGSLLNFVQMNDDMTRERLVQGVSELEERVGPPLPLAQSLHQALLGAVFPLTAEELTWVARENEAPPTVLSLLGALPRGRFASVDAVAVALEQDTGDALASPDTPAPVLTSTR
jgi:hypothetical protein